MVTKQIPWKGKDAAQIVLAVTKDNTRLKIPSYCDPVLKKVIKSTWEKNPEKRYTIFIIRILAKRLLTTPNKKKRMKMQEIFDRLAKYYSVLEHAYSDVFEDSKSSSEKEVYADAIESMDVDEANNYLIGESQGVVLVSIGGSTARGKDAANGEDEDGDDCEEDEEGEKQDDDDNDEDEDGDGDEEKNGDHRRNPGDLEKQEEGTPDSNNLQRYASIDGSDIDGGSGHDYHDVGVILSSRQ